MLASYANALIQRLSNAWSKRLQDEDAALDARYQRAGLTFLASVAASGASVLVSFITIPILLSYLGAARFGVWMTLYSFVSMLGFLDLGVGLGLLTALAHSYGTDDRAEANRYVSSAAVTMISAALLFAVLFLALYPQVSWGAVFNVPSELERETRLGVLMLAGCVLLGIPASLPARVQAGYQRGYVSSLWDLLGRAITVPAILAGIYSGAGIPTLVAIMFGVPVLTGLLNGIGLVRYQAPWLKLSIANVDASSVTWILRKGVLFFILNGMMSIAFASDDLIITQIFGPQAVGAYAVPRTLFQLVSGVVGLVLVPLWPAYGEALAKGDKLWIVTTLRRSLFAGIGMAALGAGLLVLFGNSILMLWTHSGLQVSVWLLIGFALWTIMATAGSAISMLLNAASVIRFQVVVAVAMAFTAILAKIVFARLFGPTGIIWGTATAYGLVSLLPTLVYLRRWLRAARLA
jgi:O-antigen/teichoic acid export membrane protein